MDPEKVSLYLAEVPFEIRNAVKPLSNDKAWAILIALLANDNMRFNELKKAFGAESSGDIDRHLKLLTAAGLVEKRVKLFKDIDSVEKICYYPTPLSKSLIKALFENILIRPSEDKSGQTAQDGGIHLVRMGVKPSKNRSVKKATPVSR
jgi:DNA-binding HxlR family transcriptional regulator